MVRLRPGREQAGVCPKRRDGEDTQELVKIDRAVLRIPSLAIQLQTATESEAFKINKEDHLAPTLATSVKDFLRDKGGDGDNAQRRNKGPLSVQLIASEMGADEGEIVDFKLNPLNVQPEMLGGVRNEVVHAVRLGNLANYELLPVYGHTRYLQ